MSANPAGLEAKVGRAVLDRILLDALEATGDQSQRERLAQSFSRSRVALGQVESTGPSEPRHYERIHEAEQAVRDTVALLVAAGHDHSVDKLRTLADALVAARQQALEMAGSRPEVNVVEETPAAPFRASQGIPRVHWLPTEGLVMRNRPRPTPPRFDMPHGMVDHLREVLLETARRAIFEGPDAFASPALADAGAHALALPTEERDDGLVTLRRGPRADHAGERAMLRRICVDAFEEVGALGLLLDVSGRERWEGAATLEPRLLANLDAAVALGGEGPVTVDVLDALMRWAADGPTADPFRAFAQAFVLGCVEGRGAASTAVLAMRASPPDVRLAQARALALASSPAIDEALDEVLVDAEAELLVPVLEAMRSRRRAPATTLVPLLGHVSEAVRGAVARALVVATPAGPGLDGLQRLLLEEQDDGVVAAALETLAVLDLPAARAQLRQRLADDLDEDGQLTHAARRSMGLTLAVVGEGDDLEVLMRVIDRHPKDARLAGWHGDRRWVPVLLERLTHPDPGVGLAAAGALHRITGAELPWPEDKRRDPYLPRVDESSWRAWCAEHLGGIEGTRLRLGAAFTIETVADELLAESVPMADRHLLAAELSAAVGRWVVDPRDWTVNLRIAVDEARSSKAARQHFVGGWLKPPRD